MYTVQEAKGEGIYDSLWCIQTIHDRLTNVSVTKNDLNAVLALDIKLNANMPRYDGHPTLDRLNSSLLKRPKMACLLQNSDYYTTSC